MFKQQKLAGILAPLILSPQQVKAGIFFDAIEPNAYKKGEKLDILVGDVASRFNMKEYTFDYSLFCGDPAGGIKP